MVEEIVNRVENSGIVQINLDEFYPDVERVDFDVAEFLHEGVVLLEKDFRAKLKAVDWSVYQDKYVAVHCSTDAIVPLWAFMLVVSFLKPQASLVLMGSRSDLEKRIFTDLFDQHDFRMYENKNVIVKGCGKQPIPEAVFVEFTSRLQEYAKNIMFGEACSAVPLYKRK